MDHTFVNCWALNKVAESKHSFTRYAMPTELAMMQSIFAKTRYEVKNVDSATDVMIRDALVYVDAESDGSAFTKHEIKASLSQIEQRLTPRIERLRFASNHDRKSCPQLKALHRSHAIACDASHFSEEN